MSAEAVQQKAILRQRVRALHRPETERAEASVAICHLIEAQTLWQTARAILFYVPRPDEPDIWPLVEKALTQDKIVAFPRHCHGDHYGAGQVLDPKTDLQLGRFGIPEPSSESVVVPLQRLDLTLVPGLAFTLEGGRLGRGKGYYDRLLAKISGVTCGVAFDWQIIPELPMEPHDVRLTCLVTPRTWSLASRSLLF